MGKETLDTITGIVTAIIGLAIISVILSKNANTSAVITSAGSALSGDISAATAPITGSGGMNDLGSLETGSFTS